MDGTEFTRLSLKYKRPEQYLKKIFITLSDPDQKVLPCDDQNFPKICAIFSRLHFVFKDNKI